MADPAKPPRRRCMVLGCPDYGRWQLAPNGVLPTGHPDSHYSLHHAAPGDIDQRGGALVRTPTR